MPALTNPKHELSELQAVLHLCSEDWRFFWLKNGRIAGTVQNNGYRIIRFAGRCYLEHHLVWFFTYGVWPSQLDHKNHDRADNSPSNLRLADNSENSANSKLFCTNSSGFKGVSRTPKGRWRAYIVKDYRQIFLGVYDQPEDAHEAYKVASHKYHGEFANPQQLNG